MPVTSDRCQCKCCYSHGSVGDGYIQLWCVVIWNVPGWCYGECWMPFWCVLDCSRFAMQLAPAFISRPKARAVVANRKPRSTAATAADVLSFHGWSVVLMISNLAMCDLWWWCGVSWCGQIQLGCSWCWAAVSWSAQDHIFGTFPLEIFNFPCLQKSCGNSTFLWFPCAISTCLSIL